MYNNPYKFFTELDSETNLYKYSANLYFGGKNGDKIYYGKPVIFDTIMKNIYYDIICSQMKQDYAI